MNKLETRRVILRKAEGMFMRVFKPEKHPEYPDNEEQYSATFVIAKDSVNATKINAAVKELSATIGKGVTGTCITDGEDNKHVENDKLSIKATSKKDKRPLVLDRNKNRLSADDQEELVYDGGLYDVELVLVAATKYKKVSAKIGTIVALGGGNRNASTIKPSDEFLAELSEVEHSDEDEI